MLGKVALGHTANALTDSVAEVGLDVFVLFFNLNTLNKISFLDVIFTHNVQF